MMDYEDVADSLERLKIILQEQVLKNDFEGKGEQDYRELGEHFDLAIEALKKQIPKKPNYNSNFKIKHCDCGARVLPGQRFCSYCSQAIDWSVKE